MGLNTSFKDFFFRFKTFFAIVVQWAMVEAFENNFVTNVSWYMAWVLSPQQEGPWLNSQLDGVPSSNGPNAGLWQHIIEWKHIRVSLFVGTVRRSVI